MCFFDLKIKQYVEYLKVLGIERATTEPSPAGKTKTQMLLWNAQPEPLVRLWACSKLNGKAEGSSALKQPPNKQSLPLSLFHNGSAPGGGSVAFLGL